MNLKKICAYLVLIPLAIVGSAQGSEIKIPQSTNDATVIGKLEYPYAFKFEGNPLSRMHSAADPDVNVWDGVVWMYCSQDRKVDPAKHEHHYDAMDGYHAFSSKDLINWTDHGEIFHSSQVKWAWQKGGFLWAPGAARKEGKYYLYFPIKNQEGRWRVGVAVSDSPTGPFKDSGRPLDSLEGIDPKVFIDDDGQAYIYNNPGVVAKLKPSMIELAEPARKVVYAPEEIMKDENLRYLEGPYMHKRNGRYYFSYTNWKNQTNQGFYAVGNNPYGPFEWKGAVGPRPTGAQDHHSIVEFKGQWYYFYHVAEKEFPLYKESQSRIACFDKLYYNEDGTMQMVRHTR